MDYAIKFSDTISIDALEYAVQGNAILGIRESGKSYTAGYVAEQLMSAGIAILVFDPVGIWKNLKFAEHGEGYPVVVAGGDETSDIIINEDNCVQVMDAAIKSGISLVVDFFSPALSVKAKWIRISEKMVTHLMLHNASHNVRHIFIEEAAQMIPQKIQPQHGRLYAIMEEIARMGRNAGLGYTLINQRAEEVNKAVLEITALTILHKQNGKNSLTSIEKWLRLMDIVNTGDMMRSLPKLQKGECWIVGAEFDPPVKVKVPAKKTYHPDPKLRFKSQGKLPETIKAVDISAFVHQLKAVLQIADEEKEVVKKGGNNNKAYEELEKKFSELQQQYATLYNRYDDMVGENQALQDQLQHHPAIVENVALRLHLTTVLGILQTLNSDTQKVIPELQQAIDAPNKNIRNNGADLHINDFSFNIKQPIGSGEFVGIAANVVDHLKKSEEKKEFSGIENTLGTDAYISKEDLRHTSVKKSNTVSSANIGKCARAILNFLNAHEGRLMSRPQIAVATGYSSKSSGFANAISELNTMGLIEKSGNRIGVNKFSSKIIKDILGNDYNIRARFSPDTFIEKLDACPRAIFTFLLKKGQRYTSREEIAASTGYSLTSSGFANGISNLNVLELIEKNAAGIRVNQDLYNL